MAKSRARKLADLIVTAGVDIDGNLTFDGGSTSADLTFADGDKANFGDASDLQIYHDGTNSYITDSGAGNLRISGTLLQLNDASFNKYFLGSGSIVRLYYADSEKLQTTSSGVTITGQLTASTNLIANTATYSPIVYGGSSNLQLKSNTAEMFAQFTNNGAAELYYDNSKKFETFSAGVSVTGQLNATTMHLPDGGTGLQIGNSNDLTIFHDGTDSFIKNDTGQLILRVASVESALVAVPNGAVSLYYDNSAKLATTSTGATVTGIITATGGELYLGAADTASAHINSYEVMTFNIDSDNDDTNRYFGWFKNGNSGSGTSLMRLTEDGYLGIGTDSPERGLHVVGGIHLPNNNIISWDQANGTLRNAMYVDSGDDMIIGDTNFDDIYFSTGQKTKTVVIKQTTGRVGVGTTAPSSLVHASLGNQALGFDSGIWVSANPSDYTVGRGAGITMQNADVYTGGIYGIRELNSWQGALAFYTHTGTSGNTFGTTFTEKMRITNEGKVGIGTTSPGFKLEISDDTDGAVDLLRLRNSDTTYSQTFDFSLDTGKNLSITGASGSGGVIIKPGSYGTEIRRDAGGALGAKLVLRNYSNTAGSYVRLQLAPTQAGVDDRNVTIQGENVDGNNNMAMVFKVSAGASPAEAMRINQSGNVGIGTTSPNKKLHVGVGGSSGASNYGVDGIAIEGSGNVGIQFMGGAANQQGLTFSDSSETEAGYVYYNHASNNLLLKAASNITFNSGGANEKMRLDSSGNLLIGTTTASAKLYAKKGAEGVITKFEGPAGRYVYSGTDSGGHYMEVTGTQASERVLRIQGNNGSGTYTQLFIDAGNQRIYTSSTANVGIGTATPYVNLQVQGGNNAFAAHFGHGTNNTSGYWSGISLGYNESNIYYRKVGIVAKATGDNAARQELHFLVDSANDQNSATLSDSKMMIDINGNVGIGTTSPGYKLHVNANHGDVAYISSSDPDGGPITNGRVLHIRDNYATSSLDSYVSTGWTSSPGQDIYIGKRTTSGAGYLAIKNSNGTEHFTIDMVNGHVGINKTSGFTTGGFTAPRLVIKQTANSVWGGINIESSDDDSIFALGATSTAHYIASSYRVSGGYKPMAFLTGGGERARLDTNGNLLVGKTSTSSTAAGTTLWAGGYLNSTVSSDYVARFNRLSSNGDIAQFQKDNVTVGTIGTEGGKLTIALGGGPIQRGGSVSLLGNSTDELVATLAISGPYNDFAIKLEAFGLDGSYANGIWVQTIYVAGRREGSGATGVAITVDDNVRSASSLYPTWTAVANGNNVQIKANYASGAYSIYMQALYLTDNGTLTFA